MPEVDPQYASPIASAATSAWARWPCRPFGDGSSTCSRLSDRFPRLRGRRRPSQRVLGYQFRQNLRFGPQRHLFLAHLRGLARQAPPLPSRRARLGHEQLHHSWRGSAVRVERRPALHLFIRCRGSAEPPALWLAKNQARPRGTIPRQIFYPATATVPLAARAIKPNGAKWSGPRSSAASIFSLSRPRSNRTARSSRNSILSPTRITLTASRSNCADVQQTRHQYLFPHAARADYLNDFGLITPKAIARSFTHYARTPSGSASSRSSFRPIARHHQAQHRMPQRNRAVVPLQKTPCSHAPFRRPRTCRSWPLLTCSPDASTPNMN